MLSIDTEKTRDTVICKMPSIQEDNFSNDTEFTDKMVDSLGLICAVYSKTVDEMFPRRRRAAPTAATKDANTSAQNKSPEKSKVEESKSDSKAEKSDVIIEEKKEKPAPVTIAPAPSTQ